MLDATVEDEGLSVRFDALLRAPGPLRLGDFHYIPVLFHPAKTSKGEIVGLVTALDLFLAEDGDAEMDRSREVCTHIVDAVHDLPGLRAVVEQDPINRILPHAVICFEPAPQARLSVTP